MDPIDFDDLLAPLGGVVEPDASLRPAPDPLTPFHTVVVGAHALADNTVGEWRQAALVVLDTHARDAAAFAEAFGVPVEEADVLRARVVQRLEREPIEDLRVDFEDGYGERSDDEEDGHARRAGQRLGASLKTGPRSLGLRIKTFEAAWAPRAVRTLTLFWEALLEASSSVPARMVVTLPKVTDAAQVRAACDVLARFEQHASLPAGALRLELMMESVHTLFDAEGRFVLPAFVRLAEGRCSGVHLGTFDYTASHRVPARHQHLMHPSCELARQLMRIAVGPHGPRLCDGSTHVLPLAHTGDSADNARARVHAAWRLHVDHVTHAFMLGIDQGWDLHAHQLPARWTALIAACSEGSSQGLARLAALLASRDGSATTDGIQDDVVTGQAVLSDLRRAVDVGALESATLEQLGLTGAELHVTPLVEILRGRQLPR